MRTESTLESRQTPDRVACLSGHTYADRPIALVYRGQRIQVVEILARWQIPGARCFRVRGDDESIFELCYEEMSDEWQIVPV
ncbi:MAG: hypothetical protein P8Z34_08045 [Anaerolineales bacterium]|jgi:hypothetical protein